MAAAPLEIGKKLFKENVYITIENKEDSEDFYIIRKGRVKTIQQSDDSDFPVEEELNEGDYFGVVSCMSGHPRTDSALALTDVEVFIIEKNQFGPFVAKHHKAAIKILNNMSKQLRAYDEELSLRTGGEAAVHNDEEKRPGEDLIEIARYYYGRKKYNQAIYAYVKYAQYFKEGEFFQEAKEKIQELSGLAKEAMNPQNSEGSMQRTYKNDTFLFCENEPGDELFIIQDGKVKITKVEKSNEALLAMIEPGAPIGEMAILENKPRSASAIAYGDVTALAVNKNNFETMVQNQPAMATKIITSLADRIWTTYRQLSTIRIADPIARLWDVLLYQCQKKRVKMTKGKSFTFDFGPKELVEYAALPQDKGKIYFQEMYSNPKLTLDQDKLKIEDLQELQKEVDYYRNKMLRERKRQMAKQK